MGAVQYTSKGVKGVGVVQVIEGRGSSTFRFAAGHVKGTGTKVRRNCFSVLLHDLHILYALLERNNLAYDLWFSCNVLGLRYHWWHLLLCKASWRQQPGWGQLQNVPAAYRYRRLGAEVI